LLVIPAEFEETRRKFDSKWVLSAAELMQLPIAVWWENLGVTADFIGAYYSWALLPALALFAWSALRTRGRAELVLGGMCIVGACAVIFALRGFNEYMVNTAVVAVLLPMLARALVAAWSGPRILRYLACGLGLFFAVHWGYQMALVRISPAGYVARSTPWAVDNYLRGWSSGFGVREVVEMLAREPERTLVIADAQWGNPRTALEVYTSQRLPHVHVTGVGREFLDPAEARRLRDEALPRRAGPLRHLFGRPFRYSCPVAGEHRTRDVRPTDGSTRRRRPVADCHLWLLAGARADCFPLFKATFRSKLRVHGRGE
jgi:hypothetical protein